MLKYKDVLLLLAFCYTISGNIYIILAISLYAFHLSKSKMAYS